MAGTALKPCPFCDGFIRVIERIEKIESIYTKAGCMRCNMVFEYEQYFSFSKKARVAINNPFETVWNMRVENG